MNVLNKTQKVNNEMEALKCTVRSALQFKQEEVIYQCLDKMFDLIPLQIKK